MNKKKIIWIAAVISALAAVAMFFVIRYIRDHRSSNFSERYVLYVYPDMNAADILDSIVSGAQARSRRSLERCARKENLGTNAKPGKYIVEPSFSSIYAMRMIVNGWQSPQNLTLSGTIRSKERLAQIIGAQMMVDSLCIDTLLRSDAFLSKYGFGSENVFAMILPDTYSMYWTASAESVFDRLKKEYDVFWTEERLGKADALGMTPYQVSVLASIVSGETNKAFEYPLIAGVYLNRLRKGMKLQADPTVSYCFDYKLDRVLKAHLKVDSPYNTYRYAGLPPAPINVPPKACIDAVLNPDRHGYLYFCASPAFDGTHRFAVSYNEHLRNAREFQRELTLRRKAAK